MRKLGRTSSHRRAMLCNLATSLLRYERITTTLHRAKELRSFVERLITKAKEDSVASRREVAQAIKDKEVLKKLFSQISPKFKNRSGGYTRIVRIGRRKGDSASLALIELIEKTAPAVKKKPAPAVKKKVEKKPKEVVVKPKQEKAPAVKEKRLPLFKKWFRKKAP